MTVIRLINRAWNIVLKLCAFSARGFPWFRNSDSAVVFILVPVACSLFMLGACDPVTRHKVLTTVFDGVPSLPEPESLCEEYAARKIAEMQSQSQEQAGGEQMDDKWSVHKPYEEKKCEDCHDFSQAVGLVRPANELCFMCHRNFIRGKYVHGPVSVGDCLSCHLPHSSRYTSLLEMDRSEICSKCHVEKRLAENMHSEVMNHNMECIDCHDPHFGDVKYFLK